MLLLEQREEFQRSWGEGKGEAGGRRGRGSTLEAGCPVVTSGIVMLRDCHRIHCTRGWTVGGGRREKSLFSGSHSCQSKV